MDHFYLTRNPEYRVTESMQETRDAIRKLDNLTFDKNKSWETLANFIGKN